MTTIGPNFKFCFCSLRLRCVIMRRHKNTNIYFLFFKFLFFVCHHEPTYIFTNSSAIGNNCAIYHFYENLRKKVVPNAFFCFKTCVCLCRSIWHLTFNRDRQTDRQIDGLIDRRMDGRTDGRTLEREMMKAKLKTKR